VFKLGVAIAAFAVRIRDEGYARLRGRPLVVVAVADDHEEVLLSPQRHTADLVARWPVGIH
jgi:hypothetical protein